MHELGIAQNILQIVQQSVPDNQAADVRKIRIRVGSEKDESDVIVPFRLIQPFHRVLLKWRGFW